MQTENLLDKLQNVKRIGSHQWQACCPAHDDRSPSLSVSESDDRILLHCFAGCATSDVCAALNIQEKDLFLPSTVPKPQTKTTLTTLLRTHVYRNEAGEPVAKKEIYRKPNGTKSAKWSAYISGSWRTSLNGIEPPLYNLASVIAEPETVYICEGEKDAENLEKIGFTSTSLPNGRWEKSFDNFVRDKNIIIVRDVDRTGEIKAAKAAEGALPVAKSVKIINPARMCDGLPDNGDISDVIDRIGGEKTREALIGAVAEAEPLTKQPAAPEWLKVKTDQNGEILKLEIDEPVFVRNFINEHSLKYVNGAFYNESGNVNKEAVKNLIQIEITPFFSKGIAATVKSLSDSVAVGAYFEAPEPPESKIFCQNATLTINDGTLTVDNEDETFSFNRLPIEYHSDAPEPAMWISFLNELLYPEDVATLQQFFGYCLLPTTRAQKALIITGQGGEGKSLLGAILQNIFGNNLISDRLHRLEDDRFLMARLENKLIFYDDDLHTQKLTSTGVFKTLVTNQIRVQAERKGADKYDLRPYARIICCGNQALSAVFDKSDGFFRRLIILTCQPKKRTVDDRDFADKLFVERESIFKWAVAGAVQLARNGFNFTLSERAENVLNDLKNDENNIPAFLESDYFEDGATSTDRVSFAELQTLYKIWCLKDGSEPLSNRTFSEFLKSNQSRFGILYDAQIPTEDVVAGKKIRSRVRGYRFVKLSDTALTELQFRERYNIKF